MTEAEIEKQAEEYLEPIHRMYSCNNEYYTDEVVIQAFKAGAKWGAEHAIEWHDLRENPNDLPKENGEYWGYVNYYGFQHRTIHLSDNQFEEDDVSEVIAWCELPQFKE